ncbi:DUF4332 domain-containing protein [filamentous cyanobacterium CCP5]|nr:DUF4332 domain-containing protein [filamentous cyanobacterium CCP5]
MQSRSWPIKQLPGLQPEHLRQLAELNIVTTADILRRGKTQAGLHQLASQLHLPLRYVQKWAALSDLARVPPVGCRYSGLLLHAGIASAIQLSNASPGQLHKQLLRLHVTTLTRSDLCPSPDEVVHWIQAAKHLISS